MSNKHKSLKKLAIEYMGGCCVLCGYKKCNRALHFHHLNSYEKEFNISAKTSWYIIKKELDKCVLLCANCHFETESGLIDHELLADLAER